jgi:hypothetical protein
VTGTLADNIRSYLEDDEIALMPDAPDDEARVNTWTYTVIGTDLREVAAVVGALLHVAESLRLRLADSTVRGKFYAWYDWQTGQLRCSLTSLGSLPFGAALRQSSDPEPVVHAALSDPSPGVIQMSESEAMHDPAALVDERPQLNVWVAHV